MKNEAGNQKINSTSSRSVHDADQDITNERYYHGVDIIALLFYLSKRSVWIILAAMIGAIGGRYYYAKTYVPVYQATSKIYIAGSDTSISISDLQLGSTLAKDYQEAFKIWMVHEAVAERLNLNYSSNRLSEMVSVKIPSGSHILYITTQANDPEEARLLADTYAEVVQEFIVEKMELRKPQIIEKAQLPRSPVSSSSMRTIKDGAAIGGMLVALSFIVIFLIDDRVRSADDLTNTFDLPVLGSLPMQRADGKSTTDDAALSSRHSPTATVRRIPAVDYNYSEALNTICTAISFSGNGLRKIVITSSGPNEGKTYTSFQLSLSMAKRGKKTLLIDCDLRKSVMQSRYDFRLGGKRVGLAHVLSGQCDLSEALYATNVKNLSLIPVGELVNTPLALLTSSEFDRLLKELQNAFDIIILDTPPVGSIIDAAEIARCCDGSILVAEIRKTHKRLLKEAIQRLEQANSPILGFILNKAHVSRRNYSGYNGSYENRKTMIFRIFRRKSP